MLTKRKIYITGMVLILLSLLTGAWVAQDVLAQQIQLPGNKIPQFVDPLPTLSVSGGSITVADGTQSLTLRMCEFPANVLPTGTFALGTKPQTWVWGYLLDSSGNSTCSQLISQYASQGGALDTYIGPVIVAQRGTPTQVKFINNLENTATSNLIAWTTSTDQTLHWADPANLGMPMVPCTLPPMAGDPAQCFNYAGPIPAVPHLHGGEVPPVLDGGPDAWFLSQTASGYTAHGHAYYSKDDPNNTGNANYAIYSYPNSQEAANIWFHDHTLGATRLNVYAGLAGAYVIKEAASSNLPPNDLNNPAKIIPLVIQDRMVDVNGQLFFPNIGINPEHPYWIPEFVGDTILVNGKVWPFLEVGYDRYRFLFLNGSNARFYDMSLIDSVSGVRGPRMWVIGTDGGYLDKPVLIDPNTTNNTVSKNLVVGPGERYDVVIDFNDQTWVNLISAAYAAMRRPVPDPLNLILRNTAKTPFPGGAPAPASTTGRVMQFRVATAPTSGVLPVSFNPATAIGNNPIRPNNPIERLTSVTPQVKRQLTLNEVMGMGGPLEVLVNNSKWSGLSVDTTTFTDGVRPDFSAVTIGTNTTYYSELPNEGTTELWEIINLTADAHPIHLHLVQFQLMNRQPFDVKGYNATYNALFPGGLFIGGFGPPNDYSIPNGDGALGGNPAISGSLNAKKAPPILPLPHERGWKDTVIMYPGEVTRIMVRWAPTDADATAKNYFPFDPNALNHSYVWHCHIIDHEDNEMMRPTQVQPLLIGVTRTYDQGTDY